MGVDESKQKKQGNNICEMFSLLDKSICFPGETINGSILIKVYNKPKSIKTIQLNINQQEYWYHKQTKKTKASNVVLATTSITINNTLQPGEYKFNFNIAIPTFVKSSFEYPLVDLNAFIRNFVQASSTDIQGMTNQMILIKKPATVLDSPLNLTITNNPKILFIEQGPIVIQASYPSNNYSFYSKIPINVSVNWSKSKIPLKACETSLIRKIKFLTNGVEDKNLIFKEILWHVTKPLSGGKCTFTESILVCDTEEMNNRYTYNSNNMTFPDKTQIIRFLPSIKTSCIECEYFIKILCIYDIFIKIPLISKPTLIMPLSITHYSSLDLANSMNQIGQNLENQFNMQNNMMSQYPPNQIPSMMSQQGSMINQYQPNPNEPMMHQQGTMSQYQPNPNQNKPIVPPQQMSQYQKPSDNNIYENNNETPYYNQQNQEMNNINNQQNMENNYPSAEELGPPPSNDLNDPNTEKDAKSNNPYPIFP